MIDLKANAEYDFLTALAAKLDPEPNGERFDPAQAINLREAQRAVYESDKRFRVVIAGRRFGKTILAGVELLEAAWENPGCDVWYTVTTYKQAKRVAWRIFKKLIPRRLIATKHESAGHADPA